MKQSSRKVEREINLPEEEAVLEYKGIASLIGITYCLLADQIYELTDNVEGIILDLGTGLGDLARELALRFLKAEIIGLDISSEMLKQAEILNQALNNLKFKLMDVHNLEFKDNSIDLITSHGSLHHWQDPKAVFKEIYRVLKPKGMALIADLRRDAADEIVLEASAFLNPHQKAGFLNSIAASYLPEELETLLLEAGVKDFKITEQKFSRKVIIKNLAKIRQGPQHSEKFNQLYFNLLIKK